MAVVARKKKVRLPNTYFLRALIRVSLAECGTEIGAGIVNEAHQICPYSRATRGNIDVAIYLI